MSSPVGTVFLVGGVILFVAHFIACFFRSLSQNQNESQNGVTPNVEAKETMNSATALGIFAALTKEKKVEILNNLLVKTSSYCGQWSNSHTNNSCTELEKLEEGNHDCSKIDGNSSPSCSICSNTYSDESIVVKTKVSATLISKIYNSLRIHDSPIVTYHHFDKKKCAHMFHKDCLIDCMLEKGSCPYCSKTLLTAHDIKSQVMNLETDDQPY